MAAWGYTNETSTDPGRPGVALTGAPAAGVDGTDGEHPRYTTVTGNVVREVGMYEKQSSFFIQAKTAQSTITGTRPEPFNSIPPPWGSIRLRLALRTYDAPHGGASYVW